MPDTTLAKGVNLTLDLTPLASALETLIRMLAGTRQVQVSIDQGLLNFRAPAVTPAHVETLTVRTTDPFGQFAEDLIHIPVTNRPPTLGTQPNSMVAAGEFLM